MTAIRAVIFDLDGTLVDSWAVHRRCLRSACVAIGARAPSAAAIAAAQRPTDLGTLARLVGAPAAAAALAAYHLALRADLARAPIGPVPAAAKVIEAVRRTGRAVGVCTGRSRLGAQALLDAAALPVPLWSAREDAARPKPAPDGLHRALRCAGVSGRQAVYVGDTPDDARQGEAAGVASILVRPVRGYPGAGRVINDLCELLEAIEDAG